MDGDCECAEFPDCGCADWVPVTGWRRLWIEVRHAAVMVSYRIRPYNDLLDRRIWAWQHGPRCQFFGGKPWERS
jgi:hypothetical protein